MTDWVTLIDPFYLFRACNHLQYLQPPFYHIVVKTEWV